MITVENALQAILTNVPRLPAEQCRLEDACGRVLAEDVISPLHIPLFDNSAMDGYALRSLDTASAGEAEPVYLDLSGEVAAGDTLQQNLDRELLPGQARQIFTGAMVPAGADAVIRQEDVQVSATWIGIRRPIKIRENIRFKGEEVMPRDKVLEVGTRLSPAGVGVIASLGLKAVTVFSRPRVGVLVTGSEIIGTSKNLLPGKIFDSNSYTLSAGLQEMGLPAAFQRTCRDDPETLLRELTAGLESADVLLVTGGVSVGKYDYVKEMAAKAGIEELLWRVRQKPGKPLFFGTAADRAKLFFGLPGNPASVLVCFYEYVRPALLAAMGMVAPELPRATAALSKSFTKAIGLKQFLKGRLDNNRIVTILEGQGSHMLSSFAQANCLVVLGEEVSRLEQGDQVEVHVLPV